MKTTSVIIGAKLCLDTLCCLKIPLEAIEATDASGEQRVVLDCPLLTLCLPWIPDLIDYLVVVPVDFFDLGPAGVQPLLGLEVSPIGQDRTNLSPPLAL